MIQWFPSPLAPTPPPQPRPKTSWEKIFGTADRTSLFDVLEGVGGMTRVPSCMQLGLVSNLSHLHAVPLTLVIDETWELIKSQATRTSVCVCLCVWYQCWFSHSDVIVWPWWCLLLLLIIILVVFPAGTSSPAWHVFRLSLLALFCLPARVDPTRQLIH